MALVPLEIRDVSAHRVAVVTGASSGVGAAIARGLAELGMSVAIGARRSNRLEAVAEEIEAGGGKVFAQPLDVTQYASVDEFFRATEAALGEADVIVNNAGVGRPGPIHETPPERIAHELATNLIGPFYVVRRALPRMIERGRGGDLVFIGSDAAKHPRPRQTIYSAGKAGLENFQQALSMELEGTGVRATLIRLGPAVSEFASDWGPGDADTHIPYWRRFGLQRFDGALPADQVAQTVAFAVTRPHGVLLDTLEVQPAPPIGDPETP